MYLFGRSIGITSPAGRPVHEPALLRAALCLVPDDVERLTRFRERTLDEVVVVRRQNERLLHASLAQNRRQAREQAMKRRRRVIRIEDRVQVAVQLPLAERRIDVLRDAKQVQIRVRVQAALSEVRASSPPLGANSPGAHAVSSGLSQRFAPAPRKGTTSALAMNSATSA